MQANVVAHSAVFVIFDSFIPRNLEASSSPAHPRYLNQHNCSRYLPFLKGYPMDLICVMLFTGLSPVMVTPLTDEFQEPNQVIKVINDEGYFHGEGGSKGFRGLWPEALEGLPDKKLATSALGALVAHLTRVKVSNLIILDLISVVIHFSFRLQSTELLIYLLRCYSQIWFFLV